MSNLESSATATESSSLQGGVVGDVKLIKRYPNRKLYDTGESSYVTLTDVYSYLEQGKSVRIINNATKEDITTSVLLNALVEKGKGADKATVAGMLEFVAGYIKGGSNG